jgi:hypothetical protein
VLLILFEKLITFEMTSTKPTITLRYIIRQGWLEAFESTLSDSPLPLIPRTTTTTQEIEQSSSFKPCWTNTIRVGERRDPLNTTQCSFGVFELINQDQSGTIISRVSDSSTRFKHLSSKVGLAKWSRLVNNGICPPSGWLAWDAFEHSTEGVDFDHLPEGAEFLRDVSVLHPWVMKRDGASGGKGICFVSSLAQVIECVEQGRAMEEALPFLDERRDGIADWAAQEHINRPLLLQDGHKCHLRAYVIGIGHRTFVYRKYEVRIAPHEWNMDFHDLQRHITNGGGSESHHERRFLADEFPQLKHACEHLYEFLCLVTGPPYSPETTELDPTYVPASVMGLDIMIDVDNRLYLLESNHSPASPPFDEMTRFGRHVRRFVKNVVALMVDCASNVNEFSNCEKYEFQELIGNHNR